MPNRLRELRQVADLTQQQLAERAGVAQSTLSLLEANRRQPSLRIAVCLARALGVAVEELLEART